MKVKYNLKKLLALGGATLILMTLTGCGKKADCAIDSYHAHKYVNSKGYVRYIAQEWEDYEGYERQEEYIELEQDDRKLNEYIDQRNLLRIDDNIEQIEEAKKENTDFIEYRYSYTYFTPVPIYHHIGKTTTVTFILVPHTHYSWTKDENHRRLTGETRLCTYEYTAYKIEKDENGRYVLIPSEEHKDILSIKDEYPYIKEDYYKVINADDKKEIDYEDMENDDVEHIQEEEEEQTKETGKALVKVM